MLGFRVRSWGFGFVDLSQSFGSGFFRVSVVLALRVLVFYLGFGPSGLWIWLRVWV